MGQSFELTLYVMKQIGILFLVFISLSAFGQDKKIDQLEQLYNQQHYKKVYRKANLLLANPEYDYSGLPTYYLSVSIFRLSEEQAWLKHHKAQIPIAIDSYRKFLDYPEIDLYLKAHYYELADLKYFLNEHQQQVRAWGFKNEADLMSDFLNNELKDIKGFNRPNNSINPKPTQEEESPEMTQTEQSIREQIVAYAKTFIGTKYVWAGSDPSGFDCSGYTSYVLKKFGILLSRTASGQMEGAKKIKATDSFMGDLVFFGHSGNISHVGIVVSNKGDALTMIHASTSKGVIITNVDNSTYWKPKLKGAGRVV